MLPGDIIIILVEMNVVVTGSHFSQWRMLDCQGGPWRARIKREPLTGSGSAAPSGVMGADGEGIGSVAIS